MSGVAERNEEALDVGGEDSFLRDAIRAFRRNRMARIGLVLICLLIVFALFAPLISPCLLYTSRCV